MTLPGRMLCICSAPLVKPPKTLINVVMEHSSSTTPLGLTISQAAQELGVSLGTIRRWSDMGYLESYRTPGGQRRFSQEHIDRFVDSLQHGKRERDSGLHPQAV